MACKEIKPIVSDFEHASSLVSLSCLQPWDQLLEEASQWQSCSPASTSRVERKLVIMEEIVWLALSNKHKDLWRTQLCLRIKLFTTWSSAIAGTWSIQGHLGSPLGPHQGQHVTASSPIAIPSSWQSPCTAEEVDKKRVCLCCCCKTAHCCHQ